MSPATLRNNPQPKGTMKTTAQFNKYHVGWIGLRVQKLGRAASALKRQGWMRRARCDANNRNAFDWVRPLQDHAQFMATDWSTLANRGLEGVAMWVCDAQLSREDAVTDQQWSERAFIEAGFNAKWPTGRRA